MVVQSYICHISIKNNSTKFLTLSKPFASFDFKAAVADMKYFARSKLFGSLVHKKKLWIDITSSFQVRILILSREVGGEILFFPYRVEILIFIMKL